MRGALRSGRRGRSSRSRSVDESRPAWLRVQQVVWENFGDAAVRDLLNCLRLLLECSERLATH